MRGALQHFVSTVGLAKAAHAVCGFQFDDDALRGAAHIHRADVELPHRHLHAVQGDAGHSVRRRGRGREIEPRVVLGVSHDHGLRRCPERRCKLSRVECSDPAVIMCNKGQLDAGHIGSD